MPTEPRIGMLIVGHGSRSGQARDEMLAIGTMVAAADPDLPVEVGFLELSEPPAGVALDRLVARGVTRASVLPLMLNPGGHAKSDVPAVVLAGRGRHPDVDLHYGRPLGPDHQLLVLATDRLARAGGAGLPLLVLARGTSDPDANADAYRAARLLAECNGSRLVEVGFSGVTWPSAAEALELLHRKGAGSVACISWFLCASVLVERMRGQVAELAATAGVPLVDAGHLGPDASLVPLVLERHREALGATIRMNCDACTYRHPLPGIGDRVGLPIGVGHPPLAAEQLAHAPGGSGGATGSPGTGAGSPTGAGTGSHAPATAAHAADAGNLGSATGDRGPGAGPR